MSIKELTYGLGLSLSLCFSMLPSQAETVIITQPESSVTFVEPATSTVVERTVQTVNTTALPVMPIIQSSQSSQTVVSEKPALPDFASKLRLMKEQVDLGIVKGWLTVAQADTFKEKLVSLSSLQDDLRIHGYNANTASTLEREVNLLNVGITDSMKNGNLGAAVPPNNL